MNTAILIPARKGSTRLPNKPMVKIKGETLIFRMWKIASLVKNVSAVMITTDCSKIKKHCESFGANVILTDTNCPSGTDRVAQALEKYDNQFDIVFNLQGDTPLTPPHIIEQVLKAMQEDSSIQLATPMHALQGEELKRFIKHKSSGSLTGTTVVFDKNKDALYFSKSIIPNYRNSNQIDILFQHIGLYAYKVETLKYLQKLPPSTLEKIEGLEQLRALENKISIRMVEVNLKDRTLWSVDSKDDVPIVEDIIQKEGEIVL